MTISPLRIEMSNLLTIAPEHLRHPEMKRELQNNYAIRCRLLTLNKTNSGQECMVAVVYTCSYFNLITQKTDFYRQ